MITDARAETVQLISDSAAFMAAPSQLGRARALRYSYPGFDREVWREAADLGWLALLVPEADGGVGLGSLELCTLCERLGGGLAPEPLLQAICTAQFFRGVDREKVTNGELVYLPAWQEIAGDLGEHCDNTRFQNGKLNGVKRFVYMAEGADGFLVSTVDGLALAKRDSPGLTLSVTLLQDGGHFGELKFVDTPAMAIEGCFDTVMEEITIAIAAYLLGVMRGAFSVTLEYLRTRRQFNKPIGSFQVLQHRMVDLHIQIELTNASIKEAAIVMESGKKDTTTRQAVSRAKARASDAAMLVTKQAIQLHGGIGFADEADIGLFLRKAMTLANMHGSSALHRTRYAQIARQI